MNCTQQMGRLVADPEIRYTRDGSPVASYTLAVDRAGKDAGTDFFRVSAFGKAAEFAERYLRKGVKVYITGRLQQESWTTKDGQKRTEVKIIAERHYFCESKKIGETQLTAAQEDAGFVDMSDLDSEELPFNF